MWFKVIIACVPAAVIGLVLDNFMSAWENWQVVSAMLILYGVAFIVVESLHKETKIESMDDMTYKTASDCFKCCQSFRVHRVQVQQYLVQCL